jgi:hypothetical protein
MGTTGPPDAPPLSLERETSADGKSAAVAFDEGDSNKDNKKERKWNAGKELMREHIWDKYRSAASIMNKDGRIYTRGNRKRGLDTHTRDSERNGVAKDLSDESDVHPWLL